MTPQELAALHAQCFTTPRPWSAREFTSILSHAFLIETPHAFLIGRVIADEAELLTLAVAPHARRTGTGMGLVADFLGRAAGAGAVDAFLEVAQDNAAARALYAQAGFLEAGRRKAYYTAPDGTKSDALVLRCEV